MNQSQDNTADQALVVKTKKSKFQKTALYLAVVSIIGAVASVIYLILNIDALGWESTVSASLLASAFFFLFVALVFIVIGTANVPSFKFDNQ